MNNKINSFLNGLFKCLLLIAFFISGYWTRAEIDYFHLSENLQKIERLQAETDSQQVEINQLKKRTEKIDLILDKLTKLEEFHK